MGGGAGRFLNVFTQLLDGPVFHWEFAVLKASLLHILLPIVVLAFAKILHRSRRLRDPSREAPQCRVRAARLRDGANALRT